MNSEQDHNWTNVIVYSTTFCPYCTLAKKLLDSKGIEFEEVDVGGDPEKRLKMEQLSQRHTVPQIFADGRHIGGYTDLAECFDA